MHADGGRRLARGNGRDHVRGQFVCLRGGLRVRGRSGRLRIRRGIFAGSEQAAERQRGQQRAASSGSHHSNHPPVHILTVTWATQFLLRKNRRVVHGG